MTPRPPTRRGPGCGKRVVQTLPNGTAKADLNVIGVDHGDGAPFFIWEHSDLLDDAAADRLAGHHLRLLEQFVERPDARLSELDLLERGGAAELVAAGGNIRRLRPRGDDPGLVDGTGTARARRPSRSSDRTAA